ncbi:MAG: MarR family transcriptional regulator [Actinomycetota bacterium]|nr:MarR family transcriptional regulator [Actinomycetota bacterium]
MEERTRSILDEMARCDHAFNSLYRDAARAFGLSEAAMWVLYSVDASDGPVSQRELAGTMGISKQTVNSAVASLETKGLVELHPVPGTRNRKDIVLTGSGAVLASRTVRHLREAEMRAVEMLGEDKARLFVDLHVEFVSALRQELLKEGIRHGE